MSSNIEPILEFPPSSFLSDFIIEKITVDGIDDSRTSKARIQFSGKYCGYEMTVNWKDGKKEGVGLILYPDGEPYMEMTFVNDLAEGTVLKKDEYGQIVLRGVLEHGVECGLFEEFDDEEVIWRGFYRNGKRYSILEEQELEGLYLEVSEDGKLLSVSEYDDKWRKNGRCFEGESGRLKRECLYENGVKKRVMMKEGKKRKVVKKIGKLLIIKKKRRRVVMKKVLEKEKTMKLKLLRMQKNTKRRLIHSEEY
mgnify:CR=1 FL=1